MVVGTEWLLYCDCAVLDSESHPPVCCGRICLGMDTDDKHRVFVSFPSLTKRAVFCDFDPHLRECNIIPGL